MTQWTTALISQHLPVLRRYARALERDAERADDLVQQVLVLAIERRSTYRQTTAGMRPWLLSIAHNQYVSRRRRAAVEERHLAILAARIELDSGDGDQEAAIFIGEVMQRFNALPDTQRAVLHLIAVEGMSYQETAEAIGAPIGTVMSRLSRARAALREPNLANGTRRLRIIGGTDA